MNNHFYPPQLLFFILNNWYVYSISKAYISEPLGRNYAVYIFHCPAAGPIKFVHHLN